MLKYTLGVTRAEKWLKESRHILSCSDQVQSLFPLAPSNVVLTVTKTLASNLIDLTLAEENAFCFAAQGSRPFWIFRKCWKFVPTGKTIPPLRERATIKLKKNFKLCFEF